MRIAHYVLKNFFLLYDHHGQFEINYGLDENSKIQIARSEQADIFKNKGDINIQQVFWKQWKGKEVPILFSTGQNNRDIISRKGDKVIVNFDIIASAFYLLTGWHEFVNKKRDSLGRFQFRDSIQYKLNIIHLPIVNYYFDILKTAIELAYNKELKITLWNPNSFTVCLTHDIDTCKSAWLQDSYNVLKSGDLITPFKLIAKRVFGQDEWFNFEQIISIEKKYNAKSTFFFLPRYGKINGISNADYKIRDKDIMNVMQLIRDKGNEIGVHGSTGTHNDLNLFDQDINRMGNVVGNRFHFLMFDPSTTPKVLSESGIKYDSTLGFVENFGFRRSTCYPFYLFDLETDTETNVLEIPLILMDRSLQKYMKSGPTKALEEIEPVIEEVKKFNGVFTILWHNIFYSNYKYKGWENVLLEILKRSSSENALITSGENIFKIINSKTHSKMA